MLEAFEVGTFAGRLGEVFRFRVGDGGWEEMRLVEATGLGDGVVPEGMSAPFSVVFLGAGARVLPQGTYRLEHEEIGEFDLFLVPIGRDREGVRYEAVFG